jgi:peptidoglycan/LPS O-acetylase OafA/YrhL
MGCTPTYRLGSFTQIQLQNRLMKRIAQLDGIRGLAVLLVLFFHYVWSQVHVTPGTLPAQVMKCFLWTYSGVDLFFVLSGFLITGILLDNAPAGNFFKVFYIRRACRILPLYFGALLAFIIGRHFLESDWRFIWLFKDPLPLWSYFTFTQNFMMAAADTPGPHWIDVTWSLAVEEHFYLVLPFLVWVAPRRALPWIFGAMIIAAPLLRRFLPLGDLNTYLSTPWRADSLISGSILAWCVRQPMIFDHIRTHVRKLYWILALLPPLLFLISWNGTSHNRVFEHTVYAVFYSALILLVFVDEQSPITKALCWKPLVWMGTISYGLYLLHEPISGLAHGFVRHSPPGIFSVSCAIVTAGALVLTFVIAAASYYLVERRIIAFGHRYKYTRSAPVPVEHYPDTSLQPAPVPLERPVMNR